MVRSFLRSLGVLRKAESDEQHEPLLPYTQRLTTPGCSEDDRSHGDILALHGAQNRGKRAWLFFDVLGKPTLKEVSASISSIWRKDGEPFYMTCHPRTLRMYETEQRGCSSSGNFLTDGRSKSTV